MALSKHIFLLTESQKQKDYTATFSNDTSQHILAGIHPRYKLKETNDTEGCCSIILRWSSVNLVVDFEEILLIQPPFKKMNESETVKCTIMH